MDKKDILTKFSADPKRYYQVELFETQGFERKSCATCKRFFWALDENRINCPDHSSDTYSFIGDPPTKNRFDYTEAWNCLLYTSPSPRDKRQSRMPSSA